MNELTPWATLNEFQAHFSMETYNLDEIYLNDLFLKIYSIYYPVNMRSYLLIWYLMDDIKGGQIIHYSPLFNE